MRFDKIAYLNRGYIDPTDGQPTVSDANRPIRRILSAILAAF